jgi:hypothetical protein
MLAARTWSRPVAAAAALGRRARTDASRQQLRVSRAMSIAASQQIWYNGELIPWEDANVHVLSTAVMFGMSMFEGIRAAPALPAASLPSRAACCVGALAWSSAAASHPRRCLSLTALCLASDPLVVLRA